MGIQMNIGDHVSPRAGWVAVPSGNKREQLSWARARARVIAHDMPSADRYFTTLPSGRTLTDLLNDPSIWINYDPTTVDFGLTSVVHAGEMAIGTAAFRIGKWTVLATLIHELAHVDGAPGGSDKRAEEALLHTGLGKWSEFTSGRDDPATPYNPNIAG